MPRVSVVMPAYQAAWCVGAAASSVLWQTYNDLELVVVDDGSTDGTADVVEALPGPVRSLRQENAGVGVARNRGIEAATGELIAFLDADDVAFPRHLEALVQIYDRHGGIATANGYWLFPAGSRWKDPAQGSFPSPGRAAPRHPGAELRLHGVRVPAHTSRGDRWLSARAPTGRGLALLAPGHFRRSPVWHQPRPLALYRWGTESLVSDWRATRRGGDGRAPRARRDPRAIRGGARVPGAAARRGRPAHDQPAGRRGAPRRTLPQSRRSVPTGGGAGPDESRLVWKARLMAVAPWATGPLLRTREASHRGRASHRRAPRAVAHGRAVTWQLRCPRPSAGAAASSA